jgi:uncharacterized protein
MSSGNWKELFDAACAGELDLVRYHLHHGVNVNHIHPEYTGTILVACILAKQEAAALELLAHGADPHQYSQQDGFTPLQAALHAQLHAVVQELRTLGAQASAPIQSDAHPVSRLEKLKRLFKLQLA